MDLLQKTLRIYLVTDRLRSTREGYVLTRVCPSIHPSIHLSVCPHLGGGGGGTPARLNWGVPLPGVPNRGYPTSGIPLSDLRYLHWTWPGGTLMGYPTLGTPLSDLARGIPQQGGYPTLGTPLVRPGLGGTLMGGYLTSGTPHQTWLGGTPIGGVPHLG